VRKGFIPPPSIVPETYTYIQSDHQEARARVLFFRQGHGLHELINMSVNTTHYSEAIISSFVIVSTGTIKLDFTLLGSLFWLLAIFQDLCPYLIMKTPMSTLSVLSDKVLYSWGDNEDFGRKVIVISSCLLEDIDSVIKIALLDSYHPVWGSMENNAASREKRKQLLIMLCHHKAERLDFRHNLLASKKTSYRLKINPEKWIEHARTTFSVDPRIAFSLGARFPTNLYLKAELTQLVQ
nr:phosphatidylinositol 4-kinase alpha 1 isoform X2 [Tanacetum cinerariifolium]